MEGQEQGEAGQKPTVQTLSCKVHTPAAGCQSDSPLLSFPDLVDLVEQGAKGC
jgi:hypothetical protein